MASNRRTLEQRAHDWKCWPLASFKTGASRLNVCDRLDFAKLAAVLGVDQRNLKTMDHSAVFGATGWPPGAIGPFSLSAQTNVWLDEAIFRAPTIYYGSRELNEVLEISSVALLRLPRVRVARVSADL
jgi:prolyl-tRNA editing enzyme YbaK/EbsC (Cys-tRNA(Pro) deacylase)